MIDQRVIDEIKEKTTLSTVVGRRVNLKKAGRELTGLCPFHAEKTPSFTVKDSEGFYHCFGCGAHGDAISFVVNTDGIDFRAAVERLAGEAGISLTEPDPRKPKDLEEWRPIVPLPAHPPEPPLDGWDHVYVYRDAAGKAQRYVVRRDAKAGGKKQVRPLTWGWLRDEKHPAGKVGWHFRHAAPPRSLYGLDDLAEFPDSRVIVVEGEKAADKARVLFPDLVVVTWSAGGNNVQHTDWEPLRGRDVILWPDRDRHVYPPSDPKRGQEKPWREQEGFLTMMRVAAQLEQRAAAISLIDVEDLAGDGTDAADLEIAPDDAPGWLVPRLLAWSASRDTPDPGVDEADRPYDGPRDCFVPVRVFVDGYLEDVNEAQKGEPGALAGITTGIPELDAILRGLEGGRVYVLAGATSSAKSLVALKMANAAAATPIPGEADVTYAVGIASLEMTGVELVGRSAADGIGVPTRDQLSAGTLDDTAWACLIEWAAAYGDRRIFIDESEELNIEQLSARAEHQKQVGGLDLLIVDYLQLMDRGEGNNQASLLGAITRGIKKLAKKLDIPIVLLSQLSRKVDERESHRPHKSDLRESGSIEQDADVIIFVHRPEMWLRLAEPKEAREGESEDKFLKRRNRWHERMEDAHGVLELLVDKNRGGPIGEVSTTVDLALMRVGVPAEPRARAPSRDTRQADMLARGLDGMTPVDDVDPLEGYGAAHD